VAIWSPPAARRDAVDLNEESGAPCEIALTRLELGRVLGLAGRVKAAEEEVDAAIAAFGRIAAVPARAPASSANRSSRPPWNLRSSEWNRH
jgi:hypothetical protein